MIIIRTTSNPKCVSTFVHYSLPFVSSRGQNRAFFSAGCFTTDCHHKRSIRSHSRNPTMVEEISHSRMLSAAAAASHGMGSRLHHNTPGFVHHWSEIRLPWHSRSWLPTVHRILFKITIIRKNGPKFTFLRFWLKNAERTLRPTDDDDAWIELNAPREK